MVEQLPIQYHSIYCVGNNIHICTGAWIYLGVEYNGCLEHSVRGKLGAKKITQPISYVIFKIILGGRRDSNPRLLEPQSSALTD